MTQTQVSAGLDDASMPQLLVVDRDKHTLKRFREILDGQDWTCLSATSRAEAQTVAEKEEIDIIVLDIDLPDGNGLELIAQAERQTWAPEIVVFTDICDPQEAETAIQKGAWDYIEKPATDRALQLTIKRAFLYRTEKKRARSRLVLDTSGIVGKSSSMMACYHDIAMAAQSDISVYITGETGTGKELFAKAIHRNSDRSSNSFVVVDCTVLPEDLVESILFGHTKGAYTGAMESRQGLVAQAHQGTLFLDEIGDLPPTIQSSFLRVLQEGRFRPVGSRDERHCDFRVIAATNRDLEDEVQKGRFREDLFFRLKGLTLLIPPLRLHKEDIRELVFHYSERICKRLKIKEKTFSADFWETLMAYDWPGNIRELIQALESAIASGKGESVIYSKHLPTALHAASVRQQLERNLREPSHGLWIPPADEELPPLQEVRDRAIVETESRYLKQVLSNVDYDVEAARKIAAISRSRLYALLKKYGISTRRV